MVGIGFWHDGAVGLFWRCLLAPQRSLVENKPFLLWSRYILLWVSLRSGCLVRGRDRSTTLDRLPTWWRTSEIVSPVTAGARALYSDQCRDYLQLTIGVYLYFMRKLI